MTICIEYVRKMQIIIDLIENMFYWKTAIYIAPAYFTQGFFCWHECCNFITTKLIFATMLGGTKIESAIY